VDSRGRGRAGRVGCIKAVQALLLTECLRLGLHLSFAVWNISSSPHFFESAPHEIHILFF
jgi:hypothetical protein